MTVARATGSQRVRSNSESGKGQLQGLQPVIEDWHAKKTGTRKCACLGYIL